MAPTPPPYSSNIGITATCILWLTSFLKNRQARVRFNGVLSKSKNISQGLPQGSVVAPIIFLFYKDEHDMQIPDNVVVAMYADDV